MLATAPEIYVPPVGLTPVELITGIITGGVVIASLVLVASGSDASDGGNINDDEEFPLNSEGALAVPALNYAGTHV